MAMAACQWQCLQTSNYMSCAQQGSSSLQNRNRQATVSFSRPVPKNVQGVSQRGSTRLIVYAAEGNGSCCGGREGNGSGKESCSSHESKAPPPGVAGVGAEFENMVSRSTMQEFEKEYDTGEMRGTITRDIVADVMKEIPELLDSRNGEKFVDVDAVLREAMRLSDENFVFDDEMDGTMV